MITHEIFLYQFIYLIIKIITGKRLTRKSFLKGMPACRVIIFILKFNFILRLSDIMFYEVLLIYLAEAAQFYNIVYTALAYRDFHDL